MAQKMGRNCWFELSAIEVLSTQNHSPSDDPLILFASINLSKQFFRPMYYRMIRVFLKMFLHPKEITIYFANFSLVTARDSSFPIKFSEQYLWYL